MVLEARDRLGENRQGGVESGDPGRDRVLGRIVKRGGKEMPSWRSWRRDGDEVDRKKVKIVHKTI